MLAIKVKTTKHATTVMKMRLRLDLSRWFIILKAKGPLFESIFLQ